ncbi:hypothetical protein T492DRAFT_876117 [Pavlovales sp. CCMP2436]|nr:hypothetical protein T492DRAFT_876117 [Pavlovales sp. CCMP2436]
MGFSSKKWRRFKGEGGCGDGADAIEAPSLPVSGRGKAAAANSSRLPTVEHQERPVSAIGGGKVGKSKAKGKDNEVQVKAGEGAEDGSGLAEEYDDDAPRSKKARETETGSDEEPLREGSESDDASKADGHWDNHGDTPESNVRPRFRHTPPSKRAVALESLYGRSGPVGLVVDKSNPDNAAVVDRLYLNVRALLDREVGEKR